MGAKFQVVFCTNSYVTHLYRPSERHYGPAALVVSDESSQATRWSTLGAAAAVRLTGRLVLIGDQDRLVPVYNTDTTNNVAARTLMDELFPRLPEDAKVTLTVQYRSHPAVMGYATQHIYADLWSAPKCLNRPIPPCVDWPLQAVADRDASVCSTAPPQSLEVATGSHRMAFHASAAGRCCSIWPGRLRGHAACFSGSYALAG